MVASTGRPLLDADGVAAYRNQLLPHALVVTPNLWEAGMLAGVDPPPADVDAMVEVACQVAALGATWVLVKGGHLPGVDGRGGRLPTPSWMFSATGSRYFASPERGSTHPTPMARGVRSRPPWPPTSPSTRRCTRQSRWPHASCTSPCAGAGLAARGRARAHRPPRLVGRLTPAPGTAVAGSFDPATPPRLPTRSTGGRSGAPPSGGDRCGRHRLPAF